FNTFILNLVRVNGLWERGIRRGEGDGKDVNYFMVTVWFRENLLKTIACCCLMAHNFQPYNRSDEGKDEKQPPEIGRLPEQKNPDQGRPHRANAGPDRVCRSDREGLYGPEQEHHA